MQTISEAREHCRFDDNETEKPVAVGLIKRVRPTSIP